MTPVDTGRDPSLEDFTAFAGRYGYVVTNALQNHIHRMEETAAIADAGGMLSYARVFRDSAALAQRALDAWEPLADEDVRLP